jgi:osmoprotectant transport system permease protein
MDYLNNNMATFLQSLMRHIEIVAISVLIGAFVSIPLGIYLTRHKRLALFVLAFAGTVQTIPGLVMLGFALILFGIGLMPALIVLSIYSILPILRNTYIGISQVDSSYVEAGRGIGMTDFQVLFKVELPLAASSIMSGIRISTVYTVSWATLAGMIGAGGLGDLIWTGLSTYNKTYILAGALPSAILAFVFSGLLGLLQRVLTPKGIRGESA